VKSCRRTVLTLSTIAAFALVPAAAFAQQDAAASTAGSGGMSSEAQPVPTQETSTAAPQASVAIRTLKPGMRGRRVRSLQRRLHIGVDGVYGRATKRAVMRFQRRKRLDVDGIAGPATLRALGLVPKAASTEFRASKNPPAKVTLPDSIPAKDLEVLQGIADCESGGNPSAISRDGQYRGKYQFQVDTWAAVGGSGDPAAAPEDEQDKRAWVLYDRQGTDPWPVCGPKAARAAKG